MGFHGDFAPCISLRVRLCKDHSLPTALILEGIAPPEKKGMGYFHYRQGASQYGEVWLSTSQTNQVWRVRSILGTRQFSWERPKDYQTVN